MLIFYIIGCVLAFAITTTSFVCFQHNKSIKMCLIYTMANLQISICSWIFVTIYIGLIVYRIMNNGKARIKLLKKLRKEQWKTYKFVLNEHYTIDVNHKGSNGIWFRAYSNLTYKEALKYVSEDITSNLLCYAKSKKEERKNKYNSGKRFLYPW